MTELSLTGKDPASMKTDALIIGTVSEATGPALLKPEVLPKPLRQSLTKDLAALGVTGKPDDVHVIPAGDHVKARVLILTGIGEKPRISIPHETLRRAIGAATRTISGLSKAAVAFPLEDVHAVRAAAEGAVLGAYSYAAYRSDSKTPVEAIEIITEKSRDKAAKQAINATQIVTDAVRRTRDLVNMPPRDLFPEAFAELAKTAVRGTGAKITVLDEKGLAEGGFGGLLAVGQGSARGPRLVTVSWSPARPTRTVALIGKGITFDSGGLSLKPAASMETMKSDMAGAAAVLSAVVAAAQLGLPVAVTGYLALAENMPSGCAQRPSDVITIHGGRTVEVLNTDAEGRLVLADALAAAAETQPDVMLDIATLTGAQMVALGSRVSAVMGTDEVRAEVIAASTACGEQFWPMPLPPELRDSMDSKVADIANMGDRYGGMLVAGLFLKEFTDELPWAHLDIAGPSFNDAAPHGYTPAGGTGVGVRTLLAFLDGQR